LNRLWTAWRNYWFRPGPVIDLAIARIAAVGFQLLNFFFWARPSDDFVSFSEQPHLYNPLALLRLVFRPISPDWFPTIGTMEGIYAATVLFGILALVGLATNISLLFFALGSAVLQAHAYSFNEFHHPEAILAFMLAFLALSPSGRALSVDRLILRLRDTIRVRRFTPSRPLEETSDAARWPVLALIWMFSLIYASAGFYKLKAAGLDWLNGYTLRYFLLQDGLRWDIPFSIGPAQHQVFALAMSYGSLLFELTFFLTILFPVLVPVYAVLGVLAHIGIWELMRAGFWEFLVLYLALVPWTRVLSAARQALEPAAARRRMEMIYDGECFLCLRSMAVIDSLDWLDLVRPSAFQNEGVKERCAKLGITPLDTRRELHLILPDQTIYRGFFAFRRLAWMVPALLPFAPLMYLPGAAWAGPRVYRIIASSRRRFETCENDACRI